MPRELELGLGDPPVRRYLYVSQDEQDTSSCWYEYHHDSNSKVPIPKRALTGYITGLRLHEVTSKFGKKWKLDILMDAGGPFAIRSGLNTTFSRGIILSLIAVEDKELLKGPLTIVVSPSEENKKIVFGAVYLAETGQRVKFEWDKTVELEHLVEVLQSVLGDGGLVDSEDDREADPEHGSNAPDALSNARDGQPRTSRPAGLANENQLSELKRVAVTKGLTLGNGADTELDLAALNAECGTNYDGKTIEELTVAEAIEFRKTLMLL